MELNTRLGVVSSPLLAIVLFTACAGQASIKTTADDPTRVDVGELWVEPQDIATRDLFNGPGGSALAPSPTGRFDLVAVDNTGYSPGYDVKDAEGIQWSVKLGIEAQPEVASARVLWAIGYHQPPTYLLDTWALSGGTGNPEQGLARFRRDAPGHKVIADWSWYQNPFAETPAMKGLAVANLILNNWDWKTSNNKVYEVRDASGRMRHEYIVRDLGASLGKTTFPQFLRWTPLRGFGQGSRNDVADFEQQGFIRTVDDDLRVKFDYRGIHQRLVNTLTVSDVLWTCQLLSKLSDEQLNDAFRAAGYSEADRQRFVTKLKSKVQEGLALSAS